MEDSNLFYNLSVFVYLFEVQQQLQDQEKLCATQRQELEGRYHQNQVHSLFSLDFFFIYIYNVIINELPMVFNRN